METMYAIITILIIVGQIICFITSIIIDHDKKKTTNRTFRILKRLFSILLFIAALALTYFGLFNENILFLIASIVSVVGALITFINIKQTKEHTEEQNKNEL